jgi:hypothetical protein
MPLIDLQTNLKSLKYGNDRPGGGDSGQPYIKNDINDPKNVLGLDDGFIRGGAVGALKSSVTDTLRIGKFLTDLPKGPLWIVKQAGLQFSNPKLEVKKGFGGLLSSLLTGDLGPLTGGALQPTRLYNLGINTLAQIPVNAFGLHFNRHGLLPVQDESTKYLSVVKANNENNNSKNNRLVDYLNNKLTVTTVAGRKTSLLQKLINLIPIIKGFAQPKQQTLNSYLGGPGSIYGVGTTIIKRYDYTTVHDKQNNQVPQDKGKVNYYNVLGLSTQYFVPFSFPITNQQTANLLFGTRNAATLQRQGLTPTSFSIPNSPPTPVQILDYNNIDVLNPTTVPSQINNTAVPYAQNIPAGSNGTSNSPTLRTYQKLIEQIGLQQQLSNTNSVGIYSSFNDGTKINNTKGNYSVQPLLDANQSGSIQYKNSYGEVVKIKGYTNWNQVARENRVGSFGEAKYLVAVSGSTPVERKVRAADQINLTPLFNVPNTSTTIGDKVTIHGTEFLIRDLVKFRIQAIDGDDPTNTTYMIFRAYVTQFSDNVDASWNEIKYAGRGENFYTYGGFSRKISIGFKVAALSSVEMEPMYQKLNYLMSNLMPDYKNNLLMRGPIMRMTIGNWLDGQDGILNSLSYTVPQDSPWEISLGEDVSSGAKTLNLPHIIEVNMTFTPIGSQTVGKNKVSSKSSQISHIAQNANEPNNQFIDINGDLGDTITPVGGTPTKYNIPQGK